MKTKYKYSIATVSLFLIISAACAQRNRAHGTADSMWYAFFGVSKLNFQRHAFDQWTQSNYNFTESNRPSFYLDLGGIYGKYDLGVAANLGSTFQSTIGYVGRRLTGNNSFIGSWLNIEFGSVYARLDNIVPATYTVPPSNQQLELHYNAFYLALTTKNYFNFLHYTAKLGRFRIPVNSGFFATVGWQPGARSWSYGYYDQDSTYHEQRIKPIIPKLGKFQATGGVFMGF